MIKNCRDAAIFLLTLYVLIVAIWARTNPASIGEWQAQKDIAYDTVWMQWIGDCDCTMPLEQKTSYAVAVNSHIIK